MALPRFRASLEQTRQNLRECMRKWGLTSYDYEIVLERPVPRSPMGAAEVLFTKGGVKVRVRSSKFTDAADNLRACYLAIDGARMDDKRGVREWQEALKPYLQLSAGQTQAPPPPPAPTAAQDPWAVLGLVHGASAAVVKAVYRARIAEAHPDAGGSNAEAARVNGAYRQVMAELGERP